MANERWLWQRTAVVRDISLKIFSFKVTYFNFTCFTFRCFIGAYDQTNRRHSCRTTYVLTDSLRPPYLVSDIAVVVHHRPHPADALLAAPPPQQRVLLSVSAPQQHAQDAHPRPVHVVVKDQTLGGGGASQVRGQQASFVTRTHERRLDVHEVTWRRRRADKVMKDTLVSGSLWRHVTAAAQRKHTKKNGAL